MKVLTVPEVAIQVLAKELKSSMASGSDVILDPQDAELILGYVQGCATQLEQLQEELATTKEQRDGLMFKLRCVGQALK